MAVLDLDLSEYKDDGYEFIIEDNRTFIVKDDRLLGIINNDASIDTIDLVVDNALNNPPNFQYNDANHDILGNLVSNVESSTGRNIESVVFNWDGYEFVVDGKTVKVPYSENGSVSAKKASAAINNSNLTASSEINEENVETVENYLSQILDDSEVKIVLNEDGKYEIFVNGSSIGELKENATIADAATLVKEKTTDTSGLSQVTDSRRTESRRLIEETGQDYQIHIVPEMFEEINSIHRISTDNVENCKSLYRTDMMTDELQDAYVELVGANEQSNPDKQIDKTVELLKNITLNVEYSLKAYENIDKNLGVLFNSIVEDIFAINSYNKNNDIAGYQEMTFEERQEALQEMVDTYQEVLNGLYAELDGAFPEVYNERYVEGIPPKMYVILESLMDCFIKCGGAGYATGPSLSDNFMASSFNNRLGEGSFTVYQWQRFAQFAKETNLSEKLNSYFNGEDWIDSGMCEYNDIIIFSIQGNDGMTQKYFMSNYLYDTFGSQERPVSHLMEAGAEYRNGAYFIPGEKMGHYPIDRPSDDDPDNLYMHYKYNIKDGGYYFYDDRYFAQFCYDRAANYYCEGVFLKMFENDSYQVTIDDEVAEIQSIKFPDVTHQGIFYGDRTSGWNYKTGREEVLEYHGIWGYEDYDPYYFEDLKEFVGNWCDETIMNYKSRLKDDPKDYNVFDLVDVVNEDYNSLITDITVTSESLHQYKEYVKLLPYEIETEQVEYLDFLIRDYSNYQYDGVLTQEKYKYLSQEEIALYEYLKSTDPSRAAGYINALSDTINKRIGYEEAALRLYELNRDGADISDLFRMFQYGNADGTENFLNGLVNFGAGILDLVGLGDGSFGKERTSSDYRNMYMLALLTGDNAYSDKFDAFYKEALGFNYKVGTSIGNMAIPTLVSFIPGIGKVLSPILMGVSAAGNSMREAKMGGASGLQSLLYGVVSGASEVLLERLMGGIIGLNGSNEAVQGFKGLIKSMAEEAREEFVQAYFDGLCRTVILGEPFDLGEITNEAVESAYMALFTSGIMNTVTSFGIKILDEVVMVTSDQFTSYAEFSQFVENKIADRKALIDISPETAEQLGITLKDGEVLRYNPNTNTYQRMDSRGLYRFNIPEGMINMVPISEINSTAILGENSLVQVSDFKILDGKPYVTLSDGTLVNLTGIDLKNVTEVTRAIQLARGNKGQFTINCEDTSLTRTYDAATSQWVFTDSSGVEVLRAPGGNPGETRPTRNVTVGGVSFDTNLTDAEIVAYCESRYGLQLSNVSEDGSIIDTDIATKLSRIPHGYGIPTNIEFIQMKVNHDAVSGNYYATYDVNWNGYCVGNGKFPGTVNSNAVFADGQIFTRRTNGTGDGIYASVGMAPEFTMIATPFADGTQTMVAYRVKGDLSSQSIIDAFNNADAATQEAILKGSLKYSFERGSDQSRYYDAATGRLTADGERLILLRTGETAPAFGQTGGGQEVQVPISFDYLVQLGLLEEVNPAYLVQTEDGSVKVATTMEELVGVPEGTPREQVSSRSLYIDEALRRGDISDAVAMLANLDEDSFVEFFETLDTRESSTEVEFLRAFKDLYMNGQEVAADPNRYHAFFQNFREHGNNHAINVAQYAYTVAYGNDVNMTETMYAAMAHDYGMQGGYLYVDAKAAKKIKAAGMDVKVGDIIEIESLRGLQFEDGDIQLDNFVRGNHPLNSAVAILTETNGLPADVDASLVALLAMTHSKSTSGIKVFDSPVQWNEAITKLDATIKQYNQDHNTNYQFDAERLRAVVNGTDPESQATFSRWQREALAIRDGDAFSQIVTRGENGILMQDGSVVQVSYGEDRAYDSPVLSIEEETALITDLKMLDDGTTTPIDNEFSKRIHAGESNLDFGNNTYYQNDAYSAEIEVLDPNFAPHSTFAAIEERIGEVETYNNAESRAFEIVLPKEAEGTAIGLWYEQKLAAYKTDYDQKFDELMKSNPEVYTEAVRTKKDAFHQNLRIVYK